MSRRLVNIGNTTVGWKKDPTEEDYILTYEGPDKIGWKRGPGERLVLTKDGEAVGWRNIILEKIMPEIEYRINGGKWIRSKVSYIVKSTRNPLYGQYAVYMQYTNPSLSLYGLENGYPSIVNVGDTLEIRPVSPQYFTQVVGQYADGGGGSGVWEEYLPGTSGDRYTLMSSSGYSDYGFVLDYNGDFDVVYYGLGLP